MIARNEHRLDWMVEVVPGGGGDDTGKAARERPVWVRLRYQIAGHEPATQRHDEVEGDGGQRRRLQIDVSRRPEHPVARLNIIKRDVARGVETPEAGVDQEQPDTHQPDVLRRDIARCPISPELANARSEVDQHRKTGTTRDRVHHTGCIGIMITQHLHHPTRRVPTPSGVDDPGD
jgi:hypothetical protein